MKFIKYSVAFSLIINVISAITTSNGSCGEGKGSCPNGLCCSKLGWCGDTEYHCGAGCQSEFGMCNSNGVAKQTTTKKTRIITKTIITKKTTTTTKTIITRTKTTTMKSENTPISFEINDAYASNSSKKFVVGYYTEWRYESYPPQNIPYSKLTHINYAFGLINSYSYDITYDKYKFQNLINEAHNHGVKVLLSIGGWTGSEPFSRMVASSDSREKFIENVANMLDETNADGVDIDWEYPGMAGETNSYDADNDTNNFLKLLKELREEIGSKLITAAVSTNPFVINNVPMTDASEFAKIFDFINIMVYDMAGGWSTTTTHQSCLYPADDGLGNSAYSAVKAWTEARFPLRKMVIGVPFYGRSWITNSSENNGLFQQPTGMTAPGDETNDSIWKYSSLRDSIIKNDYKSANGEWIRNWDSKAKAPTLFNTSTRQLITYDDPDAIINKVKFIYANKLAGMMIWELAGDTSDHELLSAISENMAKYNGISITDNDTKYIVGGLELDLDLSSPKTSSTPSKTTTIATTTIKTTASSKTTTITTTTTIKPTTTNNSDQCPNQDNYPCCDNCLVVFEDDNKWGLINNKAWCSITYSCLNEIKKCWSIALGYECCSQCVQAVEGSGKMKWGIENDKWCGIPESC